MFYQKAAVMNTLVLKSRIKCFCETFVSQKHWGFMHHCVFIQAQAAADGKILELPEPHNL